MSSPQPRRREIGTSLITAVASFVLLIALMDTAISSMTANASAHLPWNSGTYFYTGLSIFVFVLFLSSFWSVAVAITHNSK